MVISWISQQLGFEDEYFEYNLKYLLVVGLWPKKHWSSTQFWLYKMYEYSLHILSVVYLIITGIGTYQHKHDVPIFLSNLDKSLVAYNFVVKVVLFVWRREKLRKLLEEIATSGDRISEKRKKLMSTHVIFISAVGTAIVGAFCLLAQFKFELPVEAWMPFDPQKNRMNLIMAAEFIALAFVVPCLYRSFAMQGIVCSLIMYICDQLSELQDRLRSLKYSVETETETRKHLTKIVKKHVRLIQ